MSSKVPLNLLPIEEENRDFPGQILRSRKFDDSLAFELQNIPSVSPGTSESVEPVQRFTDFGLEITSSIFGSLISHPCMVLRKQCQVNRDAVRYHLSPFTIIPAITRLQRRQGMKCLWKGSSSCFILRGCSIALETAIAEMTPFPREITVNSSLKQMAEHLLLKCITFGLLTPFYCSSLIEIVQSDIASEKPGVLDCLKEGIQRLFRWGTPHSTRLLPVWQLVLPTTMYSLAIYVMSSIVQSTFQWFLAMKLRNQQKDLDEFWQSSSSKYFSNLSALHFGSMVANIVLFPAETVLNRLYLQGTRTIIDNLDSGMSVLPVITKYEGFVDCFNTIVAEEGAAGLYKGFGALIIEYTLLALILKAVRIAFEEIEHLVKPPITKRPNL